MDPHPLFDSAREMVKCVIHQLEKPAETFSGPLYTCFKCGSNNVFSVPKQVRSADEGATIFNECRDCQNKWITTLSESFLVPFKQNDHLIRG